MDLGLIGLHMKDVFAGLLFLCHRHLLSYTNANTSNCAFIYQTCVNCIMLKLMLR